MRNQITLLLIALTANVALSQNSDGKYLFRDSPVKLTTFYAEVIPGTSFSFMNGQLVSVMELSGGFILNNQFYFSYFMTGSSKVNTVEIPEPFSDDWLKWVDAGVKLDEVSSSAEFLFAKFKHSGLKFGYMHNTHNTVFWRAGLQFGFSGGFNMTEDQTFLGLFDNLVWESKILTLEPNIGGGVNLLPWWRINLDLGYRLMKLDKEVLEPTDTDSFTVQLGFAFGNFRNK